MHRFHQKCVKHISHFDVDFLRNSILSSAFKNTYWSPQSPGKSSYSYHLNSFSRFLGFYSAITRSIEENICVCV